MSIGFIGAGNMAIAILKGASKSMPMANFFASSPTKASKFTKEFGSEFQNNFSKDNSFIFNNCKVVILAIKPQYLKDALKQINYDPDKSNNPFVLSILAGISLDSLNDCLPHKKLCTNRCIARIMPNTPLLVGNGVSVYSIKVFDSKMPEELTLTQECEKIVQILFGSMGICDSVPEPLMDAYGGLIGSGPAYAFIIIEALADGAVKMGIPRDVALKYAAHVLKGSSQLMLTTGKHPAALKDSVSSPGGTTIAGIYELEKGGLRATLMSAVQASAQRGRELSEIMKK